ncbi:hypothetical protein Emag_003993 [Eimeria magna]
MVTAAASRLRDESPREQPSLAARGLLFRGLSLSFVGFDGDSLRQAAAAINRHSHSPQPRGGAAADAAAARTLLRQMEGWALEEGARVVDVSKEGLGAAGLFVCNFAAAFAHLRCLAEQQQQQLLLLPEAPHLLLAAIHLEPLRLLTPFWLFGCLRDRRVYAPDAHPLFRVSPAFNPPNPPLLLPDNRQQQQQQQQRQQQHKGEKQRVLLVGFTRRRRRVRPPSGLIYGMSASESDDEVAAAKEAQPATGGRAIAVHDAELAAACVEALGGQCVSAADLQLLSDGPTLAQETGAAASVEPEARLHSAVDLVVVGHLPRLLKRGVHNFSLQSASRGRGAAAELSLLQKLQQRGVACVRLQWLFDAYRIGLAPPPEAYLLSPEQCRQQEGPSSPPPSASACRQQLLQGVRLLISDAAAVREPALLQRAADLGCAEVAAVPSLLGLCPWLFRCSATRELAAILCGSRARMQLVEAAGLGSRISEISGALRAGDRFVVPSQLQRAEHATQQQPPPSAFPPLILVLPREELPGLLDLAAAVTQAVEPTAASQQGAVSARRAASSRTAAGGLSSASQQQQQQKQQQICRLVAAAQQRVLQSLSQSAVKEVQRHWQSAVEAASEPMASTETWDPRNSQGLHSQGLPLALAEARPTVVTPEWIISSWEEARCLPLDSAHGLIEVYTSGNT